MRTIVRILLVGAVFCAMTAVGAAQAIDAKTPHPVRFVLHGCILRLEGSIDQNHIALAGVGTAHSEGGLKPRAFYDLNALAPLNSWLERAAVILVADQRTTHDPQGKRVAYAMEPGTNRDWGWSVIRAGYGYARRDYDYGQKAQYVLAEQAARRERLGLWKNEEFVPPPPVEPIVVASKLPSLRVLSPKHYSEEYKRGLYRSIKTRKSMHARTLAARNGRSVDQPSRTGSFDFAGEEEAPAGIDAANQPRREAAAAADPALEERFSFPEKEKEDGFKEIRRQQAEIEDLKRQLETAKRVIRGK